MAPTSSLAIPPEASSASTSRPVSVNAYSPAPPPSSSKRQRASHQVVSSSQQQEENQQPPYTDVYSHPAAVAYATAHPRRTIPKFGPYLLLQTLGEGEFGKVKLGLHSQWGEEVAVKLIRRGSIDSSVRMSKVEREIEVLRTLKHPNIVRLYDVIETDKYIGIIIEYASGGELFDHILAHRFLREKDAAKLFSQLISGVWYIHQKKIVHRDLKLENLLLDRHRNVIITDFGFANRFEHRTDDLMQTSCGSPCYAAPELVISEGSYVGSAVDIWSCGVILYAMLAGYLPFDDDPANPDGDNINLLYKYIVNTPLSFPDYVSQSARDLLGIMLVPDPKGRATLEEVMRHKWLEQYWVVPHQQSNSSAFGRTVDELEQSALEQHQQKRLAYQRTMRANTRNTITPNVPPVSSAPSRTKPQYPEYLYETSPVDRSPQRFDDDPFAAPGTVVAQQPAASAPALADKPGRHTIQVEYDSAPRASSKREKAEREITTPTANGREKRHQKESSNASAQLQSNMEILPASTSSRAESVPYVPAKSQETPTSSPAKSTKAAPQVSQPPAQGVMHIDVPPPSITVASPPVTPAPETNGKHSRTLSAGFPSAQTAPAPVAATSSTPSKSQQALQNVADKSMLSASGAPSAEQTPAKEEAPKKTRRNTLTVMVEPISRTIRGRSKNANGRSSTTVAAASASDADKSVAMSPAPPSREASEGYPTERGTAHADKASTTKAKTVMQWFRSRSKGPRESTGVASGTVSQGYGIRQEQEPEDGRTTPTQEKSSAVNGRVTPTQEKYNKENRSSATVDKQGLAPQTPSRTPSSASSATPSFASRFGRIRTSLTVGGGAREPRSEGRPRQNKTEDTAAKVSTGLRIHHGAVDQNMITTLPPVQVMQHIREVLLDMGIEVQVESDFKYRCIRAKRRKIPGATEKAGAERSGSMAAFNLVGSAASNGVDKRGLPVPSSTFTGGNMLRGLLMRRQSSQTGNASFSEESPDTSTTSVATNTSGEPVYGDLSEDVGDEVRFSVELTRIDRLTDTFSLDIRRLKGNLRSYKFLYDTIRDRSTLKE